MKKHSNDDSVLAVLVSMRPSSTVVAAAPCLLIALCLSCGDSEEDGDTSSGHSTTPSTGSTSTSSTDTGTDSSSGSESASTTGDMQMTCAGEFSDGTSIDIATAQWLEDVPGSQSFCDFHTFAWNQFLWLIQNDGTSMVPRMMQLAPWQNLFVETGMPTAYPGGSTALVAGGLDKSQAGDDYDLVDVAGQTVLYDIRFNKVMYDSLMSRKFYLQSAYDTACSADKSGTCQNNLWVPPDNTQSLASLELKTSWRQFGTGLCPTTMYCEGDLGLVGVHLVQKTATHGEWIWGSFEHIDNVPDCAPGNSQPIAVVGPTGQPWSFFNPTTVPTSVLTTQTCDVVSSPPQCNTDPRVDPNCSPSTSECTFKPVNICRTDALPAGGASSENCAIGGDEQSTANNGGNVSCLNATIASQLPAPWNNYELIGTLWTKGTLGPMQDFRIQIFQPQETGIPYVEPVGFPYLANATMETWLQHGSTGFAPFGAQYTAGCFSCHNPPAKSFEIDLSHSIDKIRQMR